MKVSLLYNNRAGGDASLDRIRGALTLHGHDLVRVITEGADLSQLVDGPADVVVSAGGDGTVATAARTLAGRNTPLAILPIGTANNIAGSLGYLGSVEELIEGLNSRRRRRLDLGIASGPWGSRVFVESVGGGLVAAGIETMDTRTARWGEPRTARLTRALRTYHEVLSRLEPCRCRLSLDGVRLDGEFLLVEVLNTAWIGPNFDLSLDADPSDGSFSVVVAGDGDRQALSTYLRHRILGGECRLVLTTYRARRIDIEGPTRLHIDDEVHNVLPAAGVSIHIEPGALELI